MRSAAISPARPRRSPRSNASAPRRGSSLHVYFVEIMVLAAARHRCRPRRSERWCRSCQCRFLARVLPVSIRLGIYPGPLALAALFGLLTTLVFALWPLAGIGRVPAGALFRDTVDRARRRVPLAVLGATVLLALGLAALAVASAPDRTVALWFVAGAVGAFAFFRLAGAAVIHGAETARPATPPRLALGARQSAPPGRADRAGHAVARHRADGARRRRIRRGQSLARGRRPPARRGARFFLHRYPAGPARRLRRDRPGHPRRALRPGADDARPHYPAERRAGRGGGASRPRRNGRSAATAGSPMQRPCRQARGSLPAPGGRPTITVRRSSPSMPLWRAAWGSRSATR